MAPLAECQVVGGVVSVDVEPKRLVELRRVDVGSARVDDDNGSSGYPNATQDDVLRRDAKQVWTGRAAGRSILPTSIADANDLSDFYADLGQVAVTGLRGHCRD